jgi:hypothetical protein
MLARCARRLADVIPIEMNPVPSGKLTPSINTWSILDVVFRGYVLFYRGKGFHVGSDVNLTQNATPIMLRAGWDL